MHLCFLLVTKTIFPFLFYYFFFQEVKSEDERKSRKITLTPHSNKLYYNTLDKKHIDFPHTITIILFFHFVCLCL